MSLTYVFEVSPPTGAAVTAAGKVYNPNGAGIITGMAAADALTLQGAAGASLQLLLATGLTTDRPQPQPATALTGRSITSTQRLPRAQCFRIRRSRRRSTTSARCAARPAGSITPALRLNG